MMDAVTTGGRTTMIDPTTRRRLVDLSVIASSALTLGGGFLVAAEVDRSRAVEADISAVDQHDARAGRRRWRFSWARSRR